VASTSSIELSAGGAERRGGDARDIARRAGGEVHQQDLPGGGAGQGGDPLARDLDVAGGAGDGKAGEFLAGGEVVDGQRVASGGGGHRPGGGLRRGDRGGEQEEKRGGGAPEASGHGTFSSTQGTARAARPQRAYTASGGRGSPTEGAGRPRIADSQVRRGCPRDRIHTDQGNGAMQRHELSDREWVRLEPLLPKSRTGRPPKDHRLVLSALLWLAKTGAPWRDLPERFGP
jgi:hypothetical protein